MSSLGVGALKKAATSVSKDAGGDGCEGDVSESIANVARRRKRFGQINKTGWFVLA